MSEEVDRAQGKPPHLDRLSALWRRVAEHKIVQWTVAYVALAYGIQHGIVLTREAFDWPHAIEQISMLLLTLGLPVVMVFAWYHGERASRRISGPELTIIAILLAIGSLFFYVLVKPSEESATRGTPAVQQASLAAARDAAASPKGAISLAVLPFVNLSSDKEQEFFSDGMTEEITAALAKVPDLRVVARTSAFEFKGKNVDIRTMGEQLGATHLIEGSVRKAGNRLRITAQLIKADDGTHVWAEDYDRELTDIFAIQEDIARAITASLRMPLGLKPGENLVNNRAIDPDSYGKFLRARALLIARGGAPTVAQEIQSATQALALLNDVLAKNPAYAPAWAGLGAGYSVLILDSTRVGTGVAAAAGRAVVDELRPKGEAALQRAMQLDPDLPGAYAGLAYLSRTRGKLIEADELFKKALALDPFDSNTLFVSGMFYGSAGRLREGLDYYEKGHAVDPFYPNLADETAQERFVSGQNDAAIALAKTLRPIQRAQLFALIYASMGRYGDAADALMESTAGDPNSALVRVANLLRMAPQKLPSTAQLPTLPGGLDMLYLYLGAPERALGTYERSVEMGYITANRAFVWHPAYAPVRRTERFKTLMRKVGLVEYWRAKGWPDLCHPVGADDFACD